jgi:hypothetical protein
MCKAVIAHKDHFNHEYQAWVRTLDYFLQENASLKTRLAQVVDINTDKNFVDLAEHFQNEFLLNDEFIKEMQHDIRYQHDSLKRQALAGQTAGDSGFNQHQTKLRNEMERFEKKFANLRTEFNQYLVSLL